MSKNKEPAFLDKDLFFKADNSAIESDLREYCHQFPLFKKKLKYYGDASQCIVFPKIPGRILKNIGADVKVIICIRDPVKRFYSHYWHGFNLGLEDDDINSSLIEEDPEKICDNGKFPKHYLLNGRYHLHVKRYIEAFGDENVFLLKFENFINQQDVEMDKIYKFLEIQGKEIEYTKSNQSVMLNFPVLQRFVVGDSILKSILKLIFPSFIRQFFIIIVDRVNKRKASLPPISPDLRDRLAQYYHNDNLILHKKYNFDIKDWVGIKK